MSSRMKNWMMRRFFYSLFPLFVLHWWEQDLWLACVEYTDYFPVPTFPRIHTIYRNNTFLKYGFMYKKGIFL